MPSRSSDIVLVLVAILFPPAAAAFITGCSCDLIINIALTLLGYIPGHIHAFWLIYKKAQAEEQFGEGHYKYVGNGEYAALGQGSHTHHHIIPVQHQQQQYQNQQQQAQQQGLNQQSGQSKNSGAAPPAYGATQ